jgi:tetratricopeptide (TPR) repeat protein
VAWFAAERLNLVTLIRQGYRMGLWELTWLLANALAPFFDIGSHWRTWHQTHELALSAARRAGHRLAEAATLRNLARLFHHSGELDAALTAFHEALAIFAAIDDQLGVARCLRSLGALQTEQGRFDEAIEYLERSRMQLNALGYRLGEAACLRSLGVAYREKGLVAEAIGCFETGLSIFERLGHLLGKASMLLGLGIAYDQHGL